MKKEPSQRLIEVLLSLTEGALTVKQIKDKTSSSESGIKKLLLRGMKEDYVTKFRGLPLRRNRGQHALKVRAGKFEKESGRPPDYYCLTSDGLWLIRYDPAVKHRWAEVASVYANYDHIPEYFESYARLRQAIEAHPV